MFDDIPILTDDDNTAPLPSAEARRPALSAPANLAHSSQPRTAPPSADPNTFAESLFQGLTPPQAQAVRHTEGPLLILAAAGSGKTRVITRRIAFLVSCGVAPWQILALTFTNKAAGEMRERIHTVLGGAVSEDGTENRRTRGLTVTTFHSLCARLLRKYAAAAGLKPDFSIYNTSDQLTLVKKAIEAAQLSTANFQPRSVLSVISNAKNELIDAERFAAEAYDFSQKAIARVFTAYTRKLREANAVDFDDLLLLIAKLLRVNPDVRAECQRRWQYLMVDEYQDTNQAQFQIASLIAGEPSATHRPNICVVGDPDQAIYGWRGADISNILDFEKHYPAAATIKLGENFRSSPPILASADALIKHNKNRKPKPLFTSKEGGEKLDVVQCRDELHEASLVAAWLRKHHDADPAEGAAPIAWREMAIFYRTNALSRVLEEAMRSANIPYTIARGTSFYEREEVKNALAYLRVIANQADSVSLGRIINVPTRGIGDTSMGRVEELAERTRSPMMGALRNADQVEGLSARALNAMAKFVSLIDAWTGGGTFLGANISSTLAELIDRVLKESGLEAMYRAQAQTTKSESDLERLDNLAELISSAQQFELEYDAASDPASDLTGGPPSADGEAISKLSSLAGPALAPETGLAIIPAAAGNINVIQAPPLLALLRGFLESIALVADADVVDPSQGSVTLMTLHAAKGLEFPAVAIVGLEEGLLPHMRARESDEALEEERRLCFVGITRAMRRLLLTAAKYRTQRGMSERTITSRFLEELPREHVRGSDQSDPYADLQGTAWGTHAADDEANVSAVQNISSDRQRPIRELSSGGASGAGRSPFPIGSSVRHPQFGVGSVKAFTAGAQARITVEFRGAGTKTLVLEYARLTKA